ncbi:MAG: discoidin domain-containing protein, partial [Syntrophales bacterium]
MKKVLTVGLVTTLFMFYMLGMVQADPIVSQGLGSSAYTASSSYSVYTPDLAFDGNFNTSWIAPSYTGWIQVNLGQLTNVSSVLLTIQQNPAGLTTQEVWLSSQS